MNIVFEKNIGFLYDVCQVLICKTSKREGWINTFILNGREEIDNELIDKNLSQFTKIDRCWNIFTQLHPKKGRLITKLYVEFISNLAFEWNVQSFVEYITDVNLLKPKIFEWYFENQTATEEECCNELQSIQNIEDAIKIDLYEFITGEEKYSRRMRNSLLTVVEEMENFYGKQYGNLTICQKEFDYSKFKEDGEIFSPNLTWNEKIETCIVSFSTINRYVILRDEFKEQTQGWLLLGIDSDIEVEELEKTVDLIGFGKAIADTTRMEILKEIHKNGEKTLTDLSRKFNMVNAVMLYHLDILRTERILGQRHEGRRVYYWINYSRLKQAIFTINSQFGGELIETLEKTNNGYRE